MTKLQELYRKEIIPKMKKEFGYKNDLAVPKLEKAVVNIGAGRAIKDPKLLDVMIETMRRITGQAPVKTKVKKAISGFGIRKGLVVGLKVTLRGTRMFEFLNKLINVVLPRVRDFRGLSLSGFDGKGNYTVGFREHTVFPEVRSGEIEKIHGLEVTFVTTAKNNNEARALLKYYGFPFKEK
jgi:large subunit ribosomal protein L5